VRVRSALLALIGVNVVLISRVFFAFENHCDWIAVRVRRTVSVCFVRPPHGATRRPTTVDVRRDVTSFLSFVNISIVDDVKPRRGCGARCAVRAGAAQLELLRGTTKALYEDLIWSREPCLRRASRPAA
jgi:hypothetical protein